MSERIREALRDLAARDRSLKRFGAAAHRYELAAPDPTPAAYAVPTDLAEFVATIGASGAGPGYGFLGIDRVVEASRPWRKGIVVAHLGCGYAAIVSLDPPSHGEVWIDAPSIGVVERIAPTFTAWYGDWLEADPARTAVPDDVCPLPNAIAGFLAIHEQRLDVEPGTLAGPALREALEELGPHAIEIAANHSVLFPNGTRVDPCQTCARLVERLAAAGLHSDVVKPGAI